MHNIIIQQLSIFPYMPVFSTIYITHKIKQNNRYPYQYQKIDSFYKNSLFLYNVERQISPIFVGVFFFKSHKSKNQEKKQRINFHKYQCTQIQVYLKNKNNIKNNDNTLLQHFPHLQLPLRHFSYHKKCYKSLNYITINYQLQVQHTYQYLFSSVQSKNTAQHRCIHIQKQQLHIYIYIYELGTRYNTV
eukprot:TRINITY_DN1414_c2_g2_i6.p2 TRINITY_DN1414_c2_g2~~TRINITY_DN1414_c2_g2_i6.p2  ORF type:complete len:189 (+),score=-26.44 TRINITY_DN1414_c2_g2_i6:341-907(+)